jgi:hypothetical protein
MFPEVSFFFVVPLLETMEVAARNQTHDPAMLEERYMPKAAFPHQT